MQKSDLNGLAIVIKVAQKPYGREELIGLVVYQLKPQLPTVGRKLCDDSVLRVVSPARRNSLAGVRGNRNADALMVVARWNLFRGGADRERQRAAAERRTSAQDQLEDTMRRIAENVAIAYQARATSESRLNYLAQHVNSSEGTLEAYRAQFELNRRTLLDVLNATNELFNARSNLVQGSYDDLVNMYFVEASTGALASRFGGGN